MKRWFELLWQGVSEEDSFADMWPADGKCKASPDDTHQPNPASPSHLEYLLLTLVTLDISTCTLRLCSMTPCLEQWVTGPPPPFIEGMVSPVVENSLMTSKRFCQSQSISYNGDVDNNL